MENKHELEHADQNTELEHRLKRSWANSWVRTQVVMLKKKPSEVFIALVFFLPL